MIQRIQTLWLFFVVLLSVATFFFPLAVFTFNFKGLEFHELYTFIPSQVSLKSDAVVQTTPAYSLIFIQIGVGLIALISIFLFKNRGLQLKVLSSGFLLLAIYVGFLFFLKIDGLEKEIAELYSKPSLSYGVSSYFPILQLLLLILAQRAIKKDERIVRSSDRLR